MPDGYAAIPIDAAADFGSLRLCVILKRDADPVAGGLVVLRLATNARVLLGCIVDAAVNVWEWTEIWIQTASGLAGSMHAARETLTNPLLDERWDHLINGFESLGSSGGMVVTGAERQHQMPLAIDRQKGRTVSLCDSGSNSPWVLCVDDGLLRNAGLPPFTGSAHRYLHLPTKGQESPFIPVTADAPTSGRTQDLEPLLRSNGSDLIPLNVEAGKIFVRRHNPVPLSALLDVLSGRRWQGVAHGSAVIPFCGAISLLQECDRDESVGAASGGHLFLGRHGRGGRITETFHLKLHLLADMVRRVRQFVQEVRRPLLSLGEDSFEIRLVEQGTALPFLWGSQVVLSDPGDAVMLPVPGNDVEFFARRDTGLSIYQPQAVGLTLSGSCAVRIRQVIPEASGGVIVEGTLTTQDRIPCGPADVVWVEVMLASGRVNLYLHLETDSAKTQGDVRFRSVACDVGGALLSELKSAAGVTLQRSPFQLIPLLSTPCDLYSLGVLAIRTLLVDPAKFTLPVALDEMLSLARQVSHEIDPSVGLGLRIRSIFESDPRWVELLGPQRLGGESAQDSFDLIPSELWWDTLAMIIRMFPGVGPDSVCANFGDATRSNLHSVFTRTESDLASLIQRTRSLIVIDWQLNREIRSVIRQKMADLPIE